MKFGRILPVSVAHNGKIYVFDGQQGGEVFNPDVDNNGVLGKWDRFDGPPADDPNMDFVCERVFSDPVNNRIIAHFFESQYHYAYHPANDADCSSSWWECLTNNFDIGWKVNSVLVDNFIISYSMGLQTFMLTIWSIVRIPL